MVGRVLGFRVNPHHTPDLGALGFGDIQHFTQGRNLVLAIERLIAVAQRLNRAKRFDLRQREIGGKPAGLGFAVHHARGLAAGELGAGGDIGRAGDVGFVAGNQLAVFGGYQIGFDEVGPVLNGQSVAFQRVVWQVASRAPVPDDQGLLAIERRKRGCIVIATAGHQGRCAQAGQGPG